MWSFFPSVINKLPFQDHLPNINSSKSSISFVFHCNDCIWEWSVHIYICSNCVSNHASTCISFYTCLTYVTKQTLLLHCNYDLHSHHTKWTYRSNILCLSTKVQTPATDSSHIIATYVPETNILFSCHIHGKYDNYIRCTYQTKMSVCTTIKCVTSSTGIHTFHNIGICPWTNMPTRLYMYVPPYKYCSVHVDPILLQIQIKKKN